MEPVGSLFLRHLFSNFASAEPKCEESDSMTRVLCCSGSGTVVSIVVGRRPVSRCSYSFVLSGRLKTTSKCCNVCIFDEAMVACSTVSW